MVGPRLYASEEELWDSPVATHGDALPPALWTKDKKEALKLAIKKVRELEGLD
jgi:hypothetical protein